MDAKHTPGPMYVGKNADGMPAVVVDAADSTGFVVAHISRITTAWRMRGVDGDETATALLFAEAPNLLKALGAAQAALVSFQHGNASEEFAKEMADNCAAAIARATRGTS